jgi:hypothetical protein
MRSDELLPPALMNSAARDEVIRHLAQVNAGAPVRFTALLRWEFATGVKTEMWEVESVILGTYKRPHAH